MLIARCGLVKGLERRTDVSDVPAVWITGVGAATPLGNSYGSIADNLLEGHSGVRIVTGFNAAEHPSQIAGQMTSVPCPQDWQAEEFNQRNRLEQLILWCCTSALRDSGWWDRRSEIRLGIVLG